MRPCRSATIRTRLDVPRTLERVRPVVAGRHPDGFFSHGYFTDGAVGARDFRADYRYNAVRNPQTYSVYGSVQERGDWRIVRVRIEAHEPWLDRWTLGPLLFFIGLSVSVGEVPFDGAVAALAFVVAIYGVANVFFIPDRVIDRVSGQIASAVGGSVFHRGAWVVPR